MLARGQGHGRRLEEENSPLPCLARARQELFPKKPDRPDSRPKGGKPSVCETNRVDVTFAKSTNLAELWFEHVARKSPKVAKNTAEVPANLNVKDLLRHAT